MLYTNPKKYAIARRKRPKRTDLPKITYIEVQRRSKAGVVYKRMKPVLVGASRLSGAPRKSRRADKKWDRGVPARMKKYRILNAIAQNRIAIQTRVDRKQGLAHARAVKRKKELAKRK